jgi:hypothetical protein
MNSFINKEQTENEVQNITSTNHNLNFKCGFVYCKYKLNKNGCGSNSASSQPHFQKIKASVMSFVEGYLKYGFVSYTNKNQSCRIQCVICDEVLANEA